MRLEGTHAFAAPRSMVWEALLDPTVLAGALPGGEQLEQVGENDYRAVMNVKVGPVQGRFEGKITLSDIAPLERFTMKVDGQGAPGFLAGEGVLRFEDAAGGGTTLVYAGDAQVGGRIAGVGQRLIESTAKSITRQGLSALDQSLQARMAPAAVVEPVSPAAAPAVMAADSPAAAPAGQPAASPPPPIAQPSAAAMGAEVLRDVVQDLASDYIAREQQERVLFFGLGALMMLLFVVLVRLVQKD